MRRAGIQPGADAWSRIDPSGLAATYFPAVTAMSIRFDDALSLARSDQAGVTTLADEIAKAMQSIAARYALPYMKLAGNSLIAAAGCAATPDPLATVRLADAALAAREACLYVAGAIWIGAGLSYRHRLRRGARLCPGAGASRVQPVGRRNPHGGADGAERRPAPARSRSASTPTSSCASSSCSGRAGCSICPASAPPVPSSWPGRR